MKQPVEYEVTDDSGFLALIDPTAYHSFVDSKWTLEQLFQHFKSEIRHRHLLLCGTGREDIWRVEVSLSPSRATAYREFTAPICASGRYLLVTNYDSLARAAMSENIQLPQPHETSQLIPVEPGHYFCRIIQRFDPEPSDPQLGDGEADFIIELLPDKDPTAQVVPTIPWSDFE